MASGIYTALSGAIAQTTALDVTSNNIANASTPGYRTVRARFDEVLTRAQSSDQRMVVAAGPTDEGAPGYIAQTNNPLDVALDGEGHMAVLTPHGERFTRAGNLHIDAESKLSTADGNAIEGVDGKPITIPPGTAEVAIGEDGQVTADGSEIGTIKLAHFAPGALTREGSSLYAQTAQGAQAVTAVAAATTAAATTADGATPATPDGQPLPKVVSGALEHSNFSVVRGVVDLVKTSRTYEALHRMIESYKEIDDRTARTIGGG